jgi:hypothetical protein
MQIKRESNHGYDICLLFDLKRPKMTEFKVFSPIRVSSGLNFDPRIHTILRGFRKLRYLHPNLEICTPNCPPNDHIYTKLVIFDYKSSWIVPTVRPT